jgi:hypothetical protein
MKNVLKAFALIALVAIIGFSMAGCDDGSASSLLDGTWESSAGYRFNISGSAGYFRAAGSSALINSAVNRGYIRTGARMIQNIKSTGSNSWSVQWLLYSSSGNNVCTGTNWNNATLTLSSDGNTLSRYAGNATIPSATYYRR